MKELKLVSPIPPSVNHYLSYRAIMKNGRPMSMSYKTQDAQRYQKEFSNYVKKEVEAQKWEPHKDEKRHYYVDAVFYMPRTDMDTNNYWKVMLDAITDTKAVWKDDNVVCERVRRIYYDSENPRIELSIYPVEYIGIFDNAPQMDSFESVCFGCTRYKRNCSLLRRAKNGVVQKELNKYECNKYKGKK